MKDRITIRLQDGKIGCLQEYGTKDLSERLACYEDLEEKLVGHTGMDFESWLKHTTSMFDNQ